MKSWRAYCFVLRLSRYELSQMNCIISSIPLRLHADFHSGTLWSKDSLVDQLPHLGANIDQVVEHGL